MNLASRSRHATVQTWLSGYMVGFGLAGVLTGWMLGVMFLALGVMFALIASQNRR